MGLVNNILFALWVVAFVCSLWPALILLAIITIVATCTHAAVVVGLCTSLIVIGLFFRATNGFHVQI